MEAVASGSAGMSKHTNATQPNLPSLFVGSQMNS